MKIWRKNQGFSLIELLFAILFISIILLGVVRLQTSNLSLSNTQNNRLQAHFLANQGLQIVEALGYGGISGNGEYKIELSGSTYSLITLGTEPEEIGAIPFERRIQADSTGLINAYKVTASVDWEDSTGPHTVEAKRIISQ